ncbi:hypothetical protein DK926_22205 [Rhodococcus sp. Eu-32]|nr:hypothetical protein DK926_22205 [Rhodococcus sp. Eu-32]
MATFDTPMFGRDAMQHRVVEAGRNELEDVIDRFNPQAYSQIDGLAHVRAREFGFYGGAVEMTDARDRLGMHHWADRTIVGRGVLLDVHRSRIERGAADDPTSGSPIHPDELAQVAAEQAVTFERGDIVLVRDRLARSVSDRISEGLDQGMERSARRRSDRAIPVGPRGRDAWCRQPGRRGRARVSRSRVTAPQASSARVVPNGTAPAGSIGSGMRRDPAVGILVHGRTAAGSRSSQLTCERTRNSLSVRRRPVSTSISFNSTFGENYDNSDTSHPW